MADHLTDSTAKPVVVETGSVDDADAINEIYNWYVEHSPITFDITPWSKQRRLQWINDLLNEDNPYHLFVARQQNRLVGFCYNAVFRPKAAYDSTTEVTIYTCQSIAPEGTGTALYNALFDAIGRTSLHRAYAVISQPNESSIKLHRKFGFDHVGTLHEVGTKFDRRIDVAWYEKRLN